MSAEGACNPQLPVTHPASADPELAAACLRVASHWAGRDGERAYEAFHDINGRYFGGQLPLPLIVWQLTPYGHCLGQAASALDRAHPPVITLHPALLRPAWRDGPDPRAWHVPHAWLGWRFAYDVLLHECVHVHLAYVLGGNGPGHSCHDCEGWVAEVNRLSPPLGLPELRAERTRTKRVPVPDETTRTGKPATRVARVCEGTVSPGAVAMWPYGVRLELGPAEAYYASPGVPWQEAGAERNRQLVVTGAGS